MVSYINNIASVGIVILIFLYVLCGAIVTIMGLQTTTPITLPTDQSFKSRLEQDWFKVFGSEHPFTLEELEQAKAFMEDIDRQRAAK